MRSYLKIDLNKVVENYRAYERLLNGGRVMAVLKADAYGLGAARIARALEKAGCKDFAVATAEEGAALRESGINGSVLVLGYTAPEKEPLLLKNDLEQTIISPEHAKGFESENLKVQIAINTGMNRFGIDAKDQAECENFIRQISRKHRLTGLYTHLSCSADKIEAEFSRRQIKLFNAVCGRVKDLKTGKVHCLNSAAGLYGGADNRKLVRLGIMLYGLKPRRGYSLPEGIAPVFEWRSEVVLIRAVGKGERIGYGSGCVAKSAMKIAVVSTGYADGLDGRLSGAAVFIKGKPAKIVGKICMDVFFADVTDVEGISVGDEAEIIGENVTVEDLAARLEVSDYEVVTRIGKRVERIYLNE